MKYWFFYLGFSTLVFDYAIARIILKGKEDRHIEQYYHHRMFELRKMYCFGGNFYYNGKDLLFLGLFIVTNCIYL